VALNSLSCVLTKQLTRSATVECRHQDSFAMLREELGLACTICGLTNVVDEFKRCWNDRLFSRVRDVTRNETFYCL